MCYNKTVACIRLKNIQNACKMEPRGYEIALRLGAPEDTQ